MTIYFLFVSLLSAAMINAGISFSKSTPKNTVLEEIVLPDGTLYQWRRSIEVPESSPKSNSIKHDSQSSTDDKKRDSKRDSKKEEKKKKDKTPKGLVIDNWGFELNDPIQTSKDKAFTTLLNILNIHITGAQRLHDKEKYNAMAIHFEQITNQVLNRWTNRNPSETNEYLRHIERTITPASRVLTQQETENYINAIDNSLKNFSLTNEDLDYIALELSRRLQKFRKKESTVITKQLDDRKKKLTESDEKRRSAHKDEIKDIVAQIKGKPRKSSKPSSLSSKLEIKESKESAQ